MRVTTHVADVHIAVHLAVQMVEAMDGHTMSIRPEHVTNGNQAATLALLWATAIQFEVGAYVWTLESWQDSIIHAAAPLHRHFRAGRRQLAWCTVPQLCWATGSMLWKRPQSTKAAAIRIAAHMPQVPRLVPAASLKMEVARVAARSSRLMRRRVQPPHIDAATLSGGEAHVAALLAWAQARSCACAFGELGRRSRQEGHFRLALRPALAAAATHDMLYSIM